MMRWLRLLLFGLAPLVLVASAFVALVSAQPVSPGDPSPSACEPGLRKWVDPPSVILGQTTTATLVMTNTCPSEPLPVDLILVVDESNSMTRARRSAADPRPTGEPTKGAPPPSPDPLTPAPPPTEPAPGPITPPEDPGSGRDPRGGEPPFCRPGGIIDPGGPGVVPTRPSEPTKGLPPNPLTPAPDPTNPGPPGPIIGPGDPTPPGGGSDRPDIEDLEPSGAVDWVREEKSWVRSFIELPAIERDMANGRLRLGFVSFSDRARQRITLNDNPSRIQSAAGRLRGDNVTRIQQGTSAAERLFVGSGSRKSEDRIQIMIILSDFQFCVRDVRRIDQDIEVLTVGFGVRAFDLKTQYDMASERQYALSYRDLKEVDRLYDEVLSRSRGVGIEQMVIADHLADNMMLVPGSTLPPTVTVTGDLLEWHVPQPTFPYTVSYQVEPLEPGIHPVSASSAVTWTDTLGFLGTKPFQDVSVEVIPPTPTPTPTYTPTPTATNTPTATATPTPDPRYLPIAFNKWPEPTPIPSPTKCVPEEQTVDVALVVDTSGSMSETTPDGQEKLAAAIEASVELVNLLKPNDQTAVIGFNNAATLASVLTSDKTQATNALRSLPGTQQSGTRIDLGLQYGLDELTSERHKSENNRSIILVTDGVQSIGGNDAVVAVADQIRLEDIKLITIGLGANVDADLLRSIATTPELYFPAPNAEDLLDIYRAIALYIPCP